VGWGEGGGGEGRESKRACARERERESERARARERARERERQCVCVLLQVLALESLVLDENNISDQGSTKLGHSLRHPFPFLKSVLQKEDFFLKKKRSRMKAPRSLGTACGSHIWKGVYMGNILGQLTLQNLLQAT
jgi:hypothetical protein